MKYSMRAKLVFCGILIGLRLICGAGDVGFENVAVKTKGTTCTSSTSYPRYKCSGAIDGSLKGVGPTNEWASKREGVGAWIELKLPKPYRIIHVAIVNRETTYPDRAEQVVMGFNQPITVTLSTPGHGTNMYSAPLQPPQWAQTIIFTVLSMQAEPHGNVGFKEILLYACKVGRYGNRCTGMCHCQNNLRDCHPATGETAACVCASGYHKFSGLCVKDCNPDWYGLICNKQCHCTNPAQGCDQRTGTKAQCLCDNDSGYYKKDGACVQGSVPGITSLKNEHVNDGEPGQVTCTATSEPLPDLTLTVSPDTNFTKLPVDEKKGATSSVAFFFPELTDTMNITCIATSQFGKASKTLKPTLYVPPVMTEYPALISAARSITATWQPWKESQAGDGPVENYTVYWKSIVEQKWHNEWTIGSDVYTYTIHDLVPNMQYEVTVSASRPGVKGEGPMSPSTITKKKKVPTATLR